MPSGKHATGHTRKSGQLRYRTDAGKPQAAGNVHLRYPSRGALATLLLAVSRSDFCMARNTSLATAIYLPYTLVIPVVHLS